MSILVIGLSLAAVLFLLSAGLTLIFGMLGAYLGFQVVSLTGNFWVSLVAAPLLGAMLGGMVEVLVLRPVYDKEPHYQMLLTFGVLLVLEQVIRAIWGVDYRDVAAPGLLATPTHLLGDTVSTYRLFVIAFGIGMAALLFVGLDRTRAGVMVRAASTDPEMMRGLGIDVGRLRTGVFAAGTGLAALAGAVTAPLFPIELGMGFNVIIDCFIVIIIGGLGSIQGAVAASLLVGLVRALGYSFVAEWVDFATYSLLIAVLLTRPRGLFGRTARAA